MDVGKCFEFLKNNISMGVLETVITEIKFWILKNVTGTKLFRFLINNFKSSRLTCDLVK